MGKIYDAVIGVAGGITAVFGGYSDPAPDYGSDQQIVKTHVSDPAANLISSLKDLVEEEQARRSKEDEK